MPEQITKYPDVTLKVLQGAGAVCGEGVEQKILAQCPKERFCALPTGEMCIYGLDEIPNMTQITVQEIADVIAPFTGQAAQGSVSFSLLEGSFLVTAFLAGLAIGRFRKKPDS